MIRSNSAFSNRVRALVSLMVGVSLLLWSIAGPAAADDVTVDLTIPMSMTLSLETMDQSGSTHAVGPYTANFDDTINIGSTTENSSTADQCAVEAAVQTNNSTWTLTQDISDNKLYNGAETHSIDLFWDDEDRGGGHTAMLVAGETVGSGTATANEVYQVDYQIDVAWTDPSGNYTATVTYTLSP